MKKIFILIAFLLTFQPSKASPGDSIFNMNYIHSLYITFPYPNFYDSLLNTNITDEYIPVSINFNGEIYNQVGIKVKGNSSFNNPSQKKSFKLDLNKFVAGQDIHGLKKLNFNNSFKDPSFMREKLTNDFLIDHKLPAPRVTYCNIYMNSELWGLYAIVEEIDDEFCWHWFDSKDGNLFKGDPHGTLQWKGSMNQALYESDYELKNNSTQNDWSDLTTLISVINNTFDPDLVVALNQKLNTSKFIKQWAAINIFVSLDSYLGSGHNYYIYHDTVTEKFQWIAWDNNESFGSFKMAISNPQLITLDMYFAGTPGARPLCEKMISNVYYKNLYNMAYCKLRDDFTNAYFDPIIDSLRPIIQTSVYADPKKFYSNAKFDSSFNYDIKLPHEGIIVFGLKNFIAERAVAIQNSINNNAVDCSLEISENVLPQDQIMLYPNPTNDFVFVNFQHQFKDINGEIQIFNIQGQQLFELALVRKTTMIDMSNFTPGLYFIKVAESGRSLTKFIIKL